MSLTTILITWYLLGMIPFLIGTKIIKEEVTIEYFLRSLIAGIGGPIVAGFLIFLFLEDFTKTDSWENFMNKKLF